MGNSRAQRRGVRGAWRSLDQSERRTVAMMALVVGGLHVVGFFMLFALVAPHHYRLAATGGFTVGVGFTAYALGLRHAFDADHIAAIDNTTRKLMSERQRPLSVGFWFSLGHSTIVFALAFAISFGVRSLDSGVRDAGSNLHRVATWVGTLVSGSFLCLIAAANAAILLGIIRLLRDMRYGRYDERELAARLDSRGLLSRILGRATRAVHHPVQMYPVGLLFGLGFDTATEVALLVLAGGAASEDLPWYAILCLPVLFAAGMSLLDTIDGTFMNFAYGWAFAEPIRKVFYNVAVTSLSVAVALLVGSVELGGLLASQLRLSGSFWTWLEAINLNSLGFAVVGLFVATWVVALSVWRLGRIEERFRAGTADERT